MSASRPVLSMFPQQSTSGSARKSPQVLHHPRFVTFQLSSLPEKHQACLCCSLRGFPIPVYEAGTGACSGAPYNTSALFSTVLFDPEPLAPQKTLRQWLKDLHKDSLILTSFVFGLIAGEHLCLAPVSHTWLLATSCSTAHLQSGRLPIAQCHFILFMRP